MRVKKIMQIRQNRPLDIILFYALYIVFIHYGAIKILCGTNLCDWYLTRIICINNIHSCMRMLLYRIG